jgi:hypothetical protein
MFTPTDQFDNEAVKDAAWEDKADSRLGWRGSNTGMPNYRASLPWRKSHRIRLHEYANNASDASTSILAPVVGTDVGIQSEDSTVAKANSFFFDMGLAGDPIQCDAELCDLMK